MVCHLQVELSQCVRSDEQDHRKAPQRCYPMLGFKTFGNAEVTLSGIELANKINKGQFDTSEITNPGAMILQVWEAVLAA